MHFVKQTESVRRMCRKSTDRSRINIDSAFFVKKSIPLCYDVYLWGILGRTKGKGLIEMKHHIGMYIIVGLALFSMMFGSQHLPEEEFLSVWYVHLFCDQSFHCSDRHLRYFSARMDSYGTAFGYIRIQLGDSYRHRSSDRTLPARS